LNLPLGAVNADQFAKQAQKLGITPKGLSPEAIKKWNVEGAKQWNRRLKQDLTKERHAMAQAEVLKKKAFSPSSPFRRTRRQKVLGGEGLPSFGRASQRGTIGGVQSPLTTRTGAVGEVAIGKGFDPKQLKKIAGHEDIHMNDTREMTRDMVREMKGGLPSHPSLNSPVYKNDDVYSLARENIAYWSEKYIEAGPGQLEVPEAVTDFFARYGGRFKRHGGGREEELAQDLFNAFSDEQYLPTKGTTKDAFYYHPFEGGSKSTPERHTMAEAQKLKRQAFEPSSPIRRTREKKLLGGEESEYFKQSAEQLGEGITGAANRPWRTEPGKVGLRQKGVTPIQQKVAAIHEEMHLSDTPKMLEDMETQMQTAGIPTHSGLKDPSYKGVGAREKAGENIAMWAEEYITAGAEQKGVPEAVTSFFARYGGRFKKVGGKESEALIAARAKRRADKELAAILHAFRDEQFLK